MNRTPFAFEHEEGLAYFVEGSHRARFREFLANPKRRDEVVDGLNHFHHLDYRWAYDASQLSPKGVHDYLRKSGAPTRCYVLSNNPDYQWDDPKTEQFDVAGTTAELRKALDDLVFDSYGSFISCIPGRLAYYTGETQTERFILQRPPP